MANIFVCDRCGKGVGRWYRVSVSPMAMYDEMNVSHMIKNETAKDYCEECFEKIKRLIEDEPD